MTSAAMVRISPILVMTLILRRLPSIQITKAAKATMKVTGWAPRYFSK